MSTPAEGTFVSKMRDDQPSTDEALAGGPWTGSGPEQVAEFEKALAAGREDTDGDEDLGSGPTM
jgi:hypothetical protein